MSGRYTKALAIIDKALTEIDPSSLFLLTEKGWIYTAIAQYGERDTGKKRKALEEAEAVVSRLPLLKSSSAEKLREAVDNLKEKIEGRPELRNMFNPAEPGNELRGIPFADRTARIRVAEAMTYPVFSTDRAKGLLSFLFGSPAAYAESREAFMLEERVVRKWSSESASLLDQGGRVIVPAALLESLSGQGQEAFLEAFLRGSEDMDVAALPQIYLAGDWARELKETLFTREAFRRYPQASRIFRVSYQDETILLRDMKEQPVSLSLMGRDSDITGKEALGIPSFWIDAAELSGLSTEADKLTFLVRLVQLQLLAAVELKDQLAEADADERVRLTGELLTQAGIIYERGPGSFLKPSVQSLLSDSLERFLDSYRLTARAA